MSSKNAILRNLKVICSLNNTTNIESKQNLGSDDGIEESKYSNHEDDSLDRDETNGERLTYSGHDIQESSSNLLKGENGIRPDLDMSPHDKKLSDSCKLKDTKDFRRPEEDPATPDVEIDQSGISLDSD